MGHTYPTIVNILAINSNHSTTECVSMKKKEQSELNVTLHAQTFLFQSTLSGSNNFYPTQVQFISDTAFVCARLQASYPEDGLELFHLIP